LSFWWSWHTGRLLLKAEESPGCSKAGVSLTGCHRKVRESATENKPPMDLYHRQG